MGLARHARQCVRVVLGLVRSKTCRRHRSGWPQRGLDPRDSRRRLEVLPRPLSVVYLVCSGSEANELALRIARWQAAFRREGLVEGDRIALCGRTGLEWVAIDLAALREALLGGHCLVSLMWANNETGTIFPIDEIAALSFRGQTRNAKAAALTRSPRAPFAFKARNAQTAALTRSVRAPFAFRARNA